MRITGAGAATATNDQVRAGEQSSRRLFATRRVQIPILAARHAVPAGYAPREYAEAGGLMSYGASLSDAFRQVDHSRTRVGRHGTSQGPGHQERQADRSAGNPSRAACGYPRRLQGWRSWPASRCRTVRCWCRDRSPLRRFRPQPTHPDVPLDATTLIA